MTEEHDFKAALESLARVEQSYKIMLNNLELCEPKNADGTKSIPPWLRDCRIDLNKFETIRKALTQSVEEVDIEEFKEKITPVICGCECPCCELEKGAFDLIDHIATNYPNGVRIKK